MTQRRRPQQPPGNTTARDYGYKHQQARALALAELKRSEAQGIITLCPRCGRPVHSRQALDLDHTDDRMSYRGLAHRRCNRAAGARKGNLNRKIRTQRRRTRW